MPWCPKCQNEYREGITTCADCGCTLVDSLEDIAAVGLIFGEQEQMQALKEFLEYNGLTGIQTRYDEQEQLFELLVRETDRKKAARMVKIFLEQEEQRKAVTREESTASEDYSFDVEEVDIRNTEDKVEETNQTGPYQDSAEKAEDNRSSAWTLLLVGSAGFVIMISGMAGLLPIHLSGTNKYMVYGIMSALFLLFIVMGLISMKNYKIFARKAESENSLRETLERWCKDTLDAKVIDNELNLPESVSDEVLYFKRFEMMKEKLNHQFVNLDQAFLEHFIDEVYDTIFH